MKRTSEISNVTKFGQYISLKLKPFSNGATPLNLAARLGKCDIVVELLEAGADVNHLDKQGWTPLRYLLSIVLLS